MRKILSVMSMFLCFSFLSVPLFSIEIKNSSGNWLAGLGIDERFRHEYKSDFDFNNALSDNGSLFYNRLRLNADVKHKNNFELFLEGIDAQVWSHHIKKTAQKNEFDLHQAYIKGNIPAVSDLTYKLGRQELSYGKSRLIASPTWSNLINAFDALVIHHVYGNLSMDAFSGYRVKFIEEKFDKGNDDERLDGLYLSYNQSGILSSAEIYVLHQFDNNNSVIRIHRYTTGVRFAGNLAEDLTYDMELPLQFGEYGNKDIKAYALHADVVKKFSGAWKPKVGIEFNLASGDNDSLDNTNETFIPVYQTTHAPYGIMDFFRWQNMREISGYISGTFSTKLQCTTGVNLFWLDSTHDSWYNSSGSKLRTAKKDAGSFVGSEVSLVARYTLSKEIVLETGYAHFFTEQYVEDTGTHDDADWLYYMVNFKI